jgi:hypothetical protein
MHIPTADAKVTGCPQTYDVFIANWRNQSAFSDVTVPPKEAAGKEPRMATSLNYGAARATPS